MEREMDYDEPKPVFPEESRSGRPVKMRDTYDPTPNPTRPRKPRANNPNTTKWTTYRSTALRFISSLIREVRNRENSSELFDFCQSYGF